jgi:hypothetical protein
MKILIIAAFLLVVGASASAAAELASGDASALAAIAQKALGPKPADALHYEASVTKTLDQVPHGRTDCTVIKKEPVYKQGKLIGYMQRRQCPHR